MVISAIMTLRSATLIAQREGEHRAPRGMAAGYQVGMAALQVTVLSSAFLFAIDYEYKQTAQGFRLTALIVTLV